MAATPCLAQSKRPAVVLPIEVNSAISSRLAKTITASVRRELGRFADLTDLGLIDFSLSEARMSFGCMNEAEECMSAIGETVGVEIMFWGHLTQSRDGLTIRLRGIDVTRKRVVYSLDTTVRDRVELEQNIDDITNAFLSGQPYLNRKETLVKLRTTPPNAKVWIDGRSYGTTPIEATLETGFHRIRIEHDGFLPVVEEISLSGPSETLRYSLERGSALAPAPRLEHSSSTDWSFWAGSGLGIAALGAVTVGGIMHYQAYGIRGDELAQSDQYTIDDNRLRAAIANANREMDSASVAQLGQQRDDLHSLRTASHDANESSYDDKVFAGNVSLGVAGVAAIAATYLLFFHDSPAQVSARQDQVYLSFDF